MPSKNEVKIYVGNSYYHLYNRGVEKRAIFEDDQDFSVFLSYLKECLLPKNEKLLRNKLANPSISYGKKEKILKILWRKNFANEINLLAYALVPNHYHLLIKQRSANSINKFLNSLATRYSMYFNKKYKRVGPLFQGVYKAVLVETDEQLLHLSRYIHLHAFFKKQSLGKRKKQKFSEFYLSSYPNYLGSIFQKWIKPKEILQFFKTAKKTNLKDVLSYQSFVENYRKDYFKTINNLCLEK